VVVQSKNRFPRTLAGLKALDGQYTSSSEKILGAHLAALLMAFNLLLRGDCI
jgi:hypothetical protein